MVGIRSGRCGGGRGRARGSDVGWTTGLGRGAAHDAGQGPLDDLEFLTDADAPEFVADGEDLEFYEWAAGEMES